MSRDIVWTSKFKKDYKTILKRNLDKSICFRFAQTRYDMNSRRVSDISSALAHIESFMTYREFLKRIHIDEFNRKAIKLIIPYNDAYFKHKKASSTLACGGQRG